MKVEELDEPGFRAVWPCFEDLRHDLGKYIAFETRFLGPEAAEAELRAALRADLYATRRSASGVEGADRIWTRLRPEALRDDPDVSAVDALMGQLKEVDLEVGLPGLRLVVERASQVRHLTRRLHERAQAHARALGLDPETL